MMMQTRCKQLAAAILLTSVAATPCRADDQVFRLGGGKTVRGTIQNVTRDKIEVRPRAGDVVTIAADEVERIRFNAEPPQLNLARNSEKSGLLDRALENYSGLLGSLKGPAKADTEFLIARTKARIAIADPTKVADAVKALEASLAANANGFRHYACVKWLGRVHMANGDFATARTRFDALGQSPMKSHQMTAKVATGRLLLAQQKPAEAMPQFDAVVAMQPASPAETASHIDAQLGKARCLQLQANYPQATSLLTDILQKTPAENAELHARVHLQMGDCYRDQQQAKAAVRSYLKVALIYDREKAAHAEALYHLVRLWPTAGHPERSAEAAAMLRKLYPNNEWTKKLGG